MPNLNIDKAERTGYSDLDAFEIDTQITDGVSDQNETEYTNPNWSQYWGYFNKVPELKNALLLKAMWVIGLGYKTDPETEVILENITGWGKDTFKDILYNLDVVSRLNGDAYAEIIRGNDGTLLNLKPLAPDSIKIIVDRKGIIKRYEQTYRIGSKSGVRKIAIENMLHICHNRLADQIHGVSDVVAVEDVILAEQESFADMKMLSHFQARPFILFKLKTDDEAKINTFISKVNTLRNKGEDMFIPDDENVLSYEVVQVNPSNLLLAWRDDMRNKFYRTIGLPQVVASGGGQSTESESKVIYLAFEQIVKHEQKNLENQLWNQLGLKINLIHPTLIGDLLGLDEKKDGAEAVNVQKSEMTPMKNE